MSVNEWKAIWASVLKAGSAHTLGLRVCEGDQDDICE